MGQLTRDQLVSAGLNLAGRTDISTLANTWFNTWLRSQYVAWPWPFLHQRITNVVLPAGPAALQIGTGNNGVSLEMRQIRDPIWVYDSTYSTRVQARIQPVVNSKLDWDETVNNPTTNIGVPTRFKVRMSTATWGQWYLIPTPIPNKDYLLAIDYLEQPADISVGSHIPIYPNDRTMIQAVKIYGLDYMGRKDEYKMELDILSGMLVDDRMRYGTVDGENDSLPLDPGIFL